MPDVEGMAMKSVAVLASYIAVLWVMLVRTSLEWLLVDQQIVNWRLARTFVVLVAAVVEDRMHQHHKRAVKRSTDVVQILLLLGSDNSGEIDLYNTSIFAHCFDSVVLVVPSDLQHEVVHGYCECQASLPCA